MIRMCDRGRDNLITGLGTRSSCGLLPPSTPMKENMGRNIAGVEIQRGCSACVMLVLNPQQNGVWMRLGHCGLETGSLSYGKVRGTRRTRHKRDGLKHSSLRSVSSSVKQELIRDILRI